MFECPHRRILCNAQGCQLIINVKTGIIYSINCPFHLLNCDLCKALHNVTVCTYYWNVIKSQRTIPSVFKYYYYNSLPNHSQKDVFLRTNSYIETFKDRRKINYYMFMSVALSKPPFTCFHSTNPTTPKCN